LAKEITLVQAKIIKRLLRDGRSSFAEIARDLCIDSKVAKNNFVWLKRAGIINGATIHINYRMLGYKAVANLLLTVDSNQVQPLIEKIQRMQDIYTVYIAGPKGSIRVLTTLRSLQQLDAIKESIRRQFSVRDIKTVIWTDVKESHQHLAINEHLQKDGLEEKEKNQIEENHPKIFNQAKIKIDDIDLKIMDSLAIDGRMPMKKLAQEIGIKTQVINRKYQILKEKGVMKVTIQIDPTKIGYYALAIFYIIFMHSHETNLAIEKIDQIPDVISIMKTTGDYDLQVYAMIKDLEHLLKIQDSLSNIDSIAKIDMEISWILNKWPTPRQYISTF
jgi:DNA-binding Lrp family transcriptional regulator